MIIGRYVINFGFFSRNLCSLYLLLLFDSGLGPLAQLHPPFLMV